MTIPTREQLAQTPLTTELTNDELETLCKVVTVQRLEDGEMLIKEGRADNQLHGVISGNLAVGKVTGGGDWINLHLLGPGELAGEMGFIDGLPHSASIRAVGGAEVFTLDRSELESLLDEHPKLVYHVMRAIVRVVHTIVRRMNAQYVEMTNYISHQHGRY